MKFPAQTIFRIVSHIAFVAAATLSLTGPLHAAGASTASTPSATASGAATTTAVPTIQAAPAAYRVSVGDVLSFDILDDAELPTSLTIGTDGAAAFPLIGAFKIEGRTIPEAVDALRNEYLSRQLLTDPKLSLSIVTVRPVLILGEVRTPGSFAYYPGLTVEQAVGLAGGPQTAMSNPADRIIAQAKLRGTIEETDVEIVREAVYTARLYAQLRGSEKVDLKDIPESVKMYVDEASVGPVVAIEEKILKTDLLSTKNQMEILNQSIMQTEASLTILDKLKEQQEEVVALNEQVEARTLALRKRELNTESELSRVKMATSSEKSRLLELISEIGRSNRELANLKLQLETLKANREKEILTLLQEREATLKKLETQRQTTKEQMVLMAAAEVDSSKQDEVSFLYKIDRETGRGETKGRQSIQATSLTAVLPGDVIFVSIAGL
ncbi:polysaccharide biosynthesis/export family protein (plasmid) [Ensifer sp. PDNC004]|uniref:polysaccharide biosynthesis/export family protein n=1 Tax=Ensifer sp. PDNC004 TaxID=2811423 RepID=UPI001963F097|nr:polysaccharide biosynthesis/export family protein [Ensifer sp. PDNC004]QRY65421.1 polysaccharide biosynthesis/export family protein [Ensifer sp. PDNC004]